MYLMTKMSRKSLWKVQVNKILLNFQGDCAKIINAKPIEYKKGAISVFYRDIMLSFA